MMRVFSWWIAIGLLLSAVRIVCTAQTPRRYVDLADRHVRNGNIDAAITEYYRHIYLFPDDAELWNVYTRLGKAHLESGKPLECLRSMSAALERASTSDERARTRLEIALAHLILDQPIQAQITLMRILAQPPSDSALLLRVHRLSGVAHILSGQWSDAASSLYEWARHHKDSNATLKLISDMLSDTSDIPHRNPTVATVMSAIIPGSGQIYCGEYLDGLNALLLNGAMIWSGYTQIIEQRYLAAVLIGIPLVSRYYTGNLDRAERYADAFNDRARRAYAARVIAKIAEMGD